MSPPSRMTTARLPFISAAAATIAQTASPSQRAGITPSGCTSRAQRSSTEAGRSLRSSLLNDKKMDFGRFPYSKSHFAHSGRNHKGQIITDCDDVRFGSKAGSTSRVRHDRFAPKNRHARPRYRRPLCARTISHFNSSAIASMAAWAHSSS